MKNLTAILVHFYMVVLYPILFRGSDNTVGDLTRERKKRFFHSNTISGFVILSNSIIVCYKFNF